MSVTPFYVAGRKQTSDDIVVVTHPYDGRAVGRTTLATPDRSRRRSRRRPRSPPTPRPCPRTPARRPWTTSPGDSPSGPTRSPR